MTTNQWQQIETVLDDILAFPQAKRKLQLAKWFGDDAQTHALASRLVQFAEPGLNSIELPSDICGWVPLRCLGSNTGSTDYLVRSADDAAHPLAILQLGKVAFEEGPAIQNFREELKRVDSLSAECVCRIFDAGLDDFNYPFVVSELVVGTPILEAARDLNTRSIVELFRSLLINVDNAHTSNLAHGSFHPAHILRDMAGSIRFAGYAVPRILALASNNPGFILKPDTTPGEILYFSPEKLKGHQDQLSGDIYALGVIFYQMLSGSPPYGNREESRAELESAISDKVPSPIAGLEDVLNQILQKMLAKNSADRFSGLAAISTEIDNYLQGRHLKVEAKVAVKPGTLIEAILQQGRQHWVAAALGFVLVAGAGVGVMNYTSPVPVSAQRPNSPQVQKSPFEMATAFLNSTFEELRNQPEFQRALSQVYVGLTAVEAKESQPKQALESSKRAYELSAILLDRGPYSDSLSLEYALTARSYIYFLALNGDYKQALEVNQQWQRRSAKAASSNIEIIRASALANTTLASLQYESKLGTSPSASVYRKDYENLHKASAGRISEYALFVQSMLGLGEAMEQSKQSSKALQVYVELQRLLEQAILLDGKNQDLRASLAGTLVHLARFHLKSSTSGAALEESNRAIELARQSLAAQGPKQSLQRLLARALATNATALMAARRGPEAAKVQSEAIAQWQQLDRSYGLDSSDTAELNKVRLMGRG